jgi:DNA-binding response OmpR family regulator
VTARTAERDVARGIGAGADAYVKKPFSWQDVIEPIERVLAERRGGGSAAPGLSAA